MLKNLTLLRLRAFLGISGGKNGKPVSKGKIIVFAILMLYIGATFAFLSGSTAILFAPATIALGSEWLFFCMYFLVTFTLVFMLSVFETKSQLFECRDNELLLSMPIKPRYIMLSRLLSVLFLNLLEAIIIIIPAACVFLYHGGSIRGLFGSIIMIFALIPMATMLSAGVGYLVALLSAKFKKNSFVTLGFTLAFLVLYFFGYNELTKGLTALEGEDSLGAIGSLGGSVGFLRFIGEAALLSPLPLVLIFLLAAAVFVLGYFLLGRNYINIISASHASAKKRFKGDSSKGSSPFLALSRKEMARFFSSATYMLNGGIGVIFKLILAVVLLVNMGTVDELADALLLAGLNVYDILPVAAVALPIALSGTVEISGSALSLEGKNLWIIKSSPIRSVDLIHAKLVPHLILSLPTTLVLSVSAFIALGVEIIYLPFVIITPLLADLFFAFFGLFVNILMPKFDFDNEAQVIKQSGASFVTVFSGMLIGIGFAALSIYLGVLLGGLFASLTVTLITLVLAAVLYCLLTGVGRKRIERI